MLPCFPTLLKSHVALCDGAIADELKLLYAAQRIG